MIELKNVTKSYHQALAVKDLNLTVEDGEIMGLIGHNGAGKSTTLKMILGLIEPTSGQIEVMGRDMAKESVYVKQFVGYLPEESPLYANMTVTEYLMFFSEIYKLPKRKAVARIDDLLGSLKLPERDRLTGELSKGMKRKVTIARTLLHNPTLLILDEPNSGLDPLTSFFIINYLKSLREQGKTILLSAHNLFHVEHICDRVAILKDGELVVCDSMKAIQKSLGRRDYQVVFYADEKLDYEREDGNYVFRTTDISQVASVLERISENEWALVNLSVRESALEEIYVKLMMETEQQKEATS
ncbi:MAG: ABC transporter ATP-binding protein [Chloroflexi bacterium]|nr:MAG: multidrug ABC transporter ATP-binding protein [Anaerolineaceae bacterium 4572_32.2]RLC78757.1 MAG: ABC transporter ATP-binding protein [Chloroflexota bacterium]RLC85563.1 MAG: ABC transporter ATP-binding protein [Chloroflexota bacterium]HEY72748.1 ABC transporter ATP-binding protein [Thermoflexia bacterium]